MILSKRIHERIHSYWYVQMKWWIKNLDKTRIAKMTVRRIRKARRALFAAADIIRNSQNFTCPFFDNSRIRFKCHKSLRQSHYVVYSLPTMSRIKSWHQIHQFIKGVMWITWLWLNKCLQNSCDLSSNNTCAWKLWDVLHLRIIRHILTLLGTR